MNGAGGTTPVIVMTGFLGSGKTTALAHLLRDSRLENSAVIVNEFGEVGLDHGLVEAIDQDVVLLPQGCVCCALSGDLAATLERLALRREAGDVPPFERVIVETTGLADPAPVMQTIIDRPMVLCGYRLGPVFTSVDAVNAGHTLERFPEARRQVAVADRLLLTKTDLAGAAERERLTRELARLNPLAPVQIVEHGRLDPAWLLAAEREGLALPAHQPVLGAPHDAPLTTTVLRFAAALPYAALSAWMGHLVGTYGETLLRVKGVVALEGQDQPVAIHGVQHLFHPPRSLAAWPPGVTGSTIVMILDGLDPSVIRASAPAFGLDIAP